jgi:tetratricopeptide (TPR) repeat protein
MQQLNEALIAYEQARTFGTDVAAENGRAEVLKSLGRFDEALAAYDHTVEDYPQNVYAKNGRAEALKALGRLDEALTVYDNVLKEHPGNLMARDGRAETLKALGRLYEALTAYDQTIHEYVGDIVTKTGRAETLRALGRPDDALAAYERAIVEHPENVVAKNGRAETLRALGRLDDALAAYDAIIKSHGQNSFTRISRSNVLVALGRYTEALEQLPEENLTTLSDWIGYHIRGMALVKMGDVDTAVQVFERGVSDTPWVADRQVFRNALAVARIKRREFDQASAALREVTAPQVAVGGECDARPYVRRIGRRRCRARSLQSSPDRFPAHLG